MDWSGVPPDLFKNSAISSGRMTRNPICCPSHSISGRYVVASSDTTTANGSLFFASALQRRSEPFHHPGLSADDRIAQFAVCFAEPTGQPDAARHGIQFRDEEMIVGQNDVRTNHARDIGP